MGLQAHLAAAELIFSAAGTQKGLLLGRGEEEPETFHLIEA